MYPEWYNKYHNKTKYIKYSKSNAVYIYRNWFAPFPLILFDQKAKNGNWNDEKSNNKSYNRKCLCIWEEAKDQSYDKQPRTDYNE